MEKEALKILAMISLALLPFSQGPVNLISPLSVALNSPPKQESRQAQPNHFLDLYSRHPNIKTNLVFKDNILLALHYLKGDIDTPEIEWNQVRQPFEVSFSLQPSEVFAFHDNVLAEYGSPLATMDSHFLTSEGYKSIGGIPGNGVCHLASLINWAASDYGLEVLAPTDHDSVPIPGVPREFGTSIRSERAKQNLYVRNTLSNPVKFVFVVNRWGVGLTVLELVDA